MTNAMIIMAEQVRLQEEGVLKYTGRYIDVLGPDGVITKTPEIQPIHTFAAWKAMGYRVKKGEKAVAKFPIWKYVANVSKEVAEAVDETDTDHIDGEGKMFMKVAAFFTDEQVEKVD